ncbi:integral peroxisomal membrane peroxin-domain-containing protein [Dichotomocladium elegans]|nr:integral peroxisomal membrane peroxin-domain-containing protein [Dichotomocladium elegans]
MSSNGAGDLRNAYFVDPPSTLDNQSFSSPHTAQTLDQIPMPILRILVVLGPAIRQIAIAIEIITWRYKEPRLSVLAVLLWIACCWWTSAVLTVGVPTMVVVKMARDWLRVRTLRLKRERLELQRAEVAKKYDDDDQHSDYYDDDDDARLKRQRQRQEEEELISRKLQPEGRVTLDDTLRDLAVINAFVDDVRQRWSVVADRLDGSRPEVVASMLSILLYVWPAWILLNLMIGSRGILALFGTLVLIGESPWFGVMIMALRRSTLLMNILAALWAYGVALVISCGLTVVPILHSSSSEKTAKQQSTWGRIRSWVGSNNKAADMKGAAGSRSEMIFQFDVFENQRWWLGMDWTVNMMPTERQPWTDNQLVPIQSKDDFQLPHPSETVQYRTDNKDGTTIKVTIKKTWGWADDDWWVDMTGELQGRVDRNGWQYGNNAWKQLSGKPGMQTFTRRRRWCRRARLRFIYNKLKIPQHAEKYRPRGKAQLTNYERRYPYLLQTTPKKSMTDKKRKKLLHKIEKIANWLDNAVPHSPIPLGVDSLLTFIPFIGGFAGTLFSLYQVYLSTQFGIPLWLLLRMMVSLAIDFVIGLVPVVGAFLDMFYKANLYNYEALADYLEQTEAIQETRTPGPGAKEASSSSSASAGKPVHDLATTEISWSHLIHDIRQAGFSLLAHVPYLYSSVKRE